MLTLASLLLLHIPVPCLPVSQVPYKQPTAIVETHPIFKNKHRKRRGNKKKKEKKMNVEEVKLYGRKVGELIDGILYISRRKQSKHLYRGGASSISVAKKRKTAAWGIDNNILSLLKGRNVKLVVINDTETKKTYYASIGKFDSPDIKYLNFGYGIQRFLNLEHWKQGEFGKIVEALGKIERK